MELNAGDRILSLKVVYYGPAMGGKTTNLRTIHALTDPKGNTQLVSIATRDDRTLFFDLLPMELGKFAGYDVRLKLYTVPGQAHFDFTRRKVLAGADAVVFVADSQRASAEANLQSVRNLRVNLNQNRIDPNVIATVLQFNKRDLPDLLAIEEMNAALNDRRLPHFPAVASTGEGVMDCLAEAVSLAFGSLAAGSKLTSDAEAKRAAATIRRKLASFAPAPAAGAAASAAAPADGKAPHQGEWMHHADRLVTDDLDLLEEAVAANLALSDRLSSLSSSRDRGARHSAQVGALNMIARLVDESVDPAAIPKSLLEGVLVPLGLARGSVLAMNGPGRILPRALAGHRVDPLYSVPSPPAGSLAERLISAGRTCLSNDLLDAVLFGQAHPATEGIRGLLFVPFRMADGVFGGLFAYSGDEDQELDATDQAFAEAACCIVGLVRRRAEVPAGV